MPKAGKGCTAKRQCLMYPARTYREAPPDTEESSSSSEGTSEVDDFSPVLEHYLVKTFDWKVSGCSQMVSPDKGDEAEKTYYRRSPSFRFMNRTWYLHLYPNLPNMVVCLMLSGEASGPPVRLYHRFGVRDASGEIDFKINAIGNFGAGTQNVWKDSQSFLSKEELVKREYQLIRDDSITIVCRLATEECKRFLRGFHCQPTEIWKSRYRLTEQYLDMFISFRIGLRPDDSRALRIKSQLESPLFASCLVPPAGVKIECDWVVFSMLPLYLEIGKVCRMPIEMTLELYELAATFQVVGLRERCLAGVTACLTPGVVIKVLDFAKKHSLPELLEVGTKYLVSHAQQVVGTTLWMQMVKKDPERANHFYRRIAERVTAAVCP